jgi:MerR family transcriptional regulator/heat shock protein HspR
MSERHAALVRFEQDPDRVTVELLSERTGVHPERIHCYVEFGLLEPCTPVGERTLFPPAAIPRLRAIERLRRDVGVNLAGVSIILDLVERLQQLQRETERLRIER